MILIGISNRLTDYTHDFTKNLFCDTKVILIRIKYFNNVSSLNHVLIKFLVPTFTVRIYKVGTIIQIDLFM